MQTSLLSLIRNLKLNHISRREKLLLGIFTIWLVIFYINETIVPYGTASKCKWPSLTTEKSSTSEKQSNILLIADPQLIDNHTYPGRNELLLKLSQHTVDQYLKRNYQALQYQLQPSHIVFLGDLLDNGRASTDEYFNREVARFKSIFPFGNNVFTNLPGNHDIGFGDLIRVAVRDRFSRTFGEPNTLLNINGVDIIMLDTTSLSSTKDVIRTSAQNFVLQLPQKTSPRVLFSHVPLFRDINLSCGPHRESSHFNVLGHGYQYQNSLVPDISKQLLDTIEPDLIFSGDDHDYCDIEHEGGVREITVKSMSMAMGIKYPAVQLLSFISNGEKMQYKTEICYLQTPYINVVVYIILAIISIAIILVQNMRSKLNMRKGQYSILPLNNYQGNTVYKRRLIVDCFKECLVAGIGVLCIYRFLIVK
ncbi:hypothetical protein KGF56_003037 [Candida oxycetoniae]|uniref:Calcineurin-like phosphoesterase domain-containing protein n=1 Tax=Candida oxycetoniae TaxID=497107 RepID=A0AAI9WXD9_9ASCO|nr:uncharacterized protein KGF56_003037 [Candida oxycetoniae]KAI3404137.2 hypothetical protein KGF56_003037 [Candida oxycetoniae]